MRALSGKEFCRLLESRGWSCQRINGSHHIYTKPGRVERISVPVHSNQTLKIGLQRSLMKAAGIAEHEI